VVKEMLEGWERQFPGRIDTIFGAIKNVSPSQLADTELFNFTGLQLERESLSEPGHFEVESQIRAINIS
jgi:tRNA 2-thiocytidine biosynthesis protein TtcA